MWHIEQPGPGEVDMGSSPNVNLSLFNVKKKNHIANLPFLMNLYDPKNCIYKVSNRLSDISCQVKSSLDHTKGF